MKAIDRSLLRGIADQEQDDGECADCRLVRTVNNMQYMYSPIADDSANWT